MSRPQTIEEAICNASDQAKRSPNQACWDKYQQVLQQLLALEVEPERITPTAEGGFMLYWFHPDGYSGIEIDNDAEIVGLNVVHTTKVIDTWDILEITKSDLARLRPK
jgi:hypothetical protein